MSLKLLSSRNPYPFPKLENENDFNGSVTKQKHPYTKPSNIAQKQNPWNRLHLECTLASSRREVCRHDPQVPCDSLDFIIKSQYDHQLQFLKARNETLHQPDTFTENHGRVLKNRIKKIIIPPLPLCHPLVVTAQKQRESVHSMKNAIESYHSQTTNRGYARKHDGGFFSS